MKILFTQAPFVTVDDEFVSIRPVTFKDKVLRLVQYYTGKQLVAPCQKNLRYGVRAGSRWPFTFGHVSGYFPFPFMLAYSAALVKENGYDVDLIDAIVDKNYSYEKYLKQVKAAKPDIVVLECAAISMEIDLKIAKAISEFAQVALAGPHLTDAEALELQQKNPFVKYILKGEYIKSSLKMVQTQKSGIYDSEIVTNLDDIPFPFRDFKNADKYYDGSVNAESRPQLQIYASKGCPFRCKFCMWPQTMYKGNVAQHSPKLIAQEIKENLKKYPYKNVFFDDDTFNIGTERISELCDYLKEIGLPWTMMGRLDCSPLWLYDKMVESGCTGMRFGIETFNLDCLKRINKGIERVDFVNTLKYLIEKYPDLWLHVTMMKDMPGQTEEIHQQDIKILHDMGFTLNCGKHSYQLSVCSPYKGTVLYKELEEKLGAKYLEEHNKLDGGRDTLMTELNRQGFWDKE